MYLPTRTMSEPPADEKLQVIKAGTAACRRYGPSKTNVADIARLLGKSPASLYRIFPSKAAIWDAIAGNFFENDLHRIPTARYELVGASAHLTDTVLGQHRLLLQALHGDSQMFNLIILAAGSNWPSFGRYRKRVHGVVRNIIRAGVETTEFASADVDAAATCFCASLVALWDPRLVGTWTSSLCGISAQELVAFAVDALG